MLNPNYVGEFLPSFVDFWQNVLLLSFNLALCVYVYTIFSADKLYQLRINIHHLHMQHILQLWPSFWFYLLRHFACMLEALQISIEAQGWFLEDRTLDMQPQRDVFALCVCVCAREQQESREGPGVQRRRRAWGGEGGGCSHQKSSQVNETPKPSDPHSSTHRNRDKQGAGGKRLLDLKWRGGRWGFSFNAWIWATGKLYIFFIIHKYIWNKSGCLWWFSFISWK